jgi:hypothetical protein
MNVGARPRRTRGGDPLPGGRPDAPPHFGWRFWRRPWLRAFWNRAYKENITGLSGMVAYNLMLAVFPFVLLVLFVFGQVVNSPDIERSVILDIQRLFPNIEQDTLQHATGSERARQPSGSRRSSAGSGSAPPFGARWTPPSAGSTTSSAAAGCSRNAGPW